MKLLSCFIFLLGSRDGESRRIQTDSLLKKKEVENNHPYCAVYQPTDCDNLVDFGDRTFRLLRWWCPSLCPGTQGVIPVHSGTQGVIPVHSGTQGAVRIHTHTVCAPHEHRQPQIPPPHYIVCQRYQHAHCGLPAVRSQCPQLCASPASQVKFGNADEFYYNGACWDPYRQPPSPDPNSDLIIAIGDSHTEGKDNPQLTWTNGVNVPWPNYLQQLIDSHSGKRFRVLNRGCAGEQVQMMIDRMDEDLGPIANRVAVAVVMAGTNNLWSHVCMSSVEVFQVLQKLHSKILALLPTKAKLLVLAVPQGGPSYPETGAGAQMVKEVNEFLNVAYSNSTNNSRISFVNVYEIPGSGKDKDGFPMMYDWTHFGPEGHRLLANMVYGKLPKE